MNLNLQCSPLNVFLFLATFILLISLNACDKEEPAQTIFKYKGKTSASYDLLNTDTSGVNRVLWDTVYDDQVDLEMDYIASNFKAKLMPKQRIVGPTDSVFTFYFIDTAYRAYPDAYSNILFQRTDDSLFMHYVRDSGTVSNYAHRELMFRGALEK